MAIVAHLVERAEADGRHFINDIRACVVAIDDAVDGNDAAVRARAATVLQAAGIDVPADYFDTNRALAATFDAAGDYAVWAGEKVGEAVA